MRVVLVSPHWPPERAQNGIVTYVARLADPLRARGVEVQVLAQQVDADVLAEVREAGVAITRDERDTPAHYVANRLLRRVDVGAADTTHLAWQLARALRRLHRQSPVDLYETEEALGHGRLLHGATTAKQLVRLHGPWFLCVPALGLDRNALENVKRVEWEGDAIRRADVVSSPCRFALDEVRRRYEAPLANAAVIPNPMPLEEERTWSRAEAGPASILFVGRFDRLKGADTVLEAFARLHASREEATLTFVGPDRGLADGTKLDAFLERAVPREARARIQVLGARTPAEIRELRPRHAVTVVASRYETFPMTALEAMAAGCPLIASRAGGIPEVLDWADDLLFEPGDAAGLAHRLEQLLDAPERAAALGARGREICKERYAPEAVAKATAALYRHTCGMV